MTTLTPTATTPTPATEGIKRPFLERVVSIDGRAGRLEFLIAGVAYSVAVFSSLVLFVVADVDTAENPAVLFAAWGLAMLPYLAASVRRLHDIGRSGWFLLLGVLPIFSAVLLMVLLLQRGDRHANEFGPARS